MLRIQTPGLRSAIGILVPIIQQVCLKAELTTPSQIADVLKDHSWKRKMWPTSDPNNTEANKLWRHLSEYVSKYLLAHVITNPGGTLSKVPQRLGSLVTLVFGVALHEREWPLTDVLLRRFAVEEEADLRAVSVPAAPPQQWYPLSSENKHGHNRQYVSFRRTSYGEERVDAEQLRLHMPAEVDYLSSAAAHLVLLE